jgi:hypothetical protein
VVTATFMAGVPRGKLHLIELKEKGTGNVVHKSFAKKISS